MRFIDVSSNVTIRLLFAKNKVAPVIKITLPLLKLSVALLLPRSPNKALASVSVKVKEVLSG